jgi:thioredoxin reductase (NADPH)
VNVGCIPKKLFHRGALLRGCLDDASNFGWVSEAPPATHQWDNLTSNVRSYIKSLNWGYKSDLLGHQVTYENALVRFVDPHTLLATYKSGKEKLFSADQVVLAMGGRPRYPDIPGVDLAITSDDIFTLPRPPGHTLIIGASCM